MFKNQELLYKHFRTKNVGIKTGYMAYHDPEFFFVIYLAYVNMSIINAIVVAFSLYNWIFARFQIYFQLYNFVLLPYIIKNCFVNRKERDLVYYGFIICYFIFFYYEQVIGGVGLGYKSNYF